MFKKLFLVLILICVESTWAQDVASLLRNFEEKSYNPKYKGLSDLVVDMEVPGLTEQLNQQMIFGNIKELTFRFYWTASPERIAVEIIGMPDGFNEIKQQMKQAMLAKFEAVIPLGLEKKFIGYKLSLDSRDQYTIQAKDEKAINVIPEYKLSFSKDGLMASIKGNKPVGTLDTVFEWEKTKWSEPRSVNKKTSSKSIDGPQVTTIETNIEWQVVSTVGVPLSVTSETKQIISIPGSKIQENKTTESVSFKNYKINVGEALKWFLANSSN